MTAQAGQVRANRSLLAARQAEALRLRVEGLTIRQIADRLEVSVGTVSNDLQAAQQATITPLVAELRETEGAKLDLLEGRIRGVLAEPRDQGTLLKAVDRALRIAERRARLMGLDMPPQVQMGRPAVVDTQADVELRELIAEARSALEGPGVPGRTIKVGGPGGPARAEGEVVQGGSADLAELIAEARAALSDEGPGVA